MKNYYKKLVSITALMFFAVVSFAQTYENSVYVLNEGGFMSSNASVSALKTNLMIENDIYFTKNSNTDLGDVAQSMAFEGDYAYVIVNNSNYIKVLNRNTFELEETISNQISNPRSIAFYDGKGYVTNWGNPGITTDDYVAVIDLATKTVTSTISVAEGPEEIVESNGILFVAHQGGWGQGNSVSVIDALTNTVESIAVGDVPSELAIDNTYLYVLCSGSPYYATSETAGQLVKIDLTDYTNKTTYTFANSTDHPQFLTLDSSSLFYILDSEVYKMDLTDTALPTSSFIDLALENVQTPYAFEKIGHRFYVGDAVDYSSNGKVFVYDEAGVFISNYEVGISPNDFYYNDQPYAPAAGQVGSTAISKDDVRIVAWATNVEVTRGLINISAPTQVHQGSSYATFGLPENAVGEVDAKLVSLGDAGEAIVTFAQPIKNDDGFDFAIFENGFNDTFLELAFVEVSSDGVNYFRFPSHSKTQTTTQIGGFGAVDATKLNNLAGKYKANFGTPFDISDIADNVLLDKNSITHIKLIDVVGSINPLYARYDSFGNAINELFATPFWSSGFDLNAVGVINQITLGLKDLEKNNTIALYPNPALSSFQISEIGTLEVYSMSGRLVLQQDLKEKQTPVFIDNLVSGIYIVKLTNANGTRSQKLIKR